MDLQTKVEGFSLIPNKTLEDIELLSQQMKLILENFKHLKNEHFSKGRFIDKTLKAMECFEKTCEEVLKK